jgi:1-phosphofructokinase
MVTTVCLNPAVDQNANVGRLEIGEVNRLRSMRTLTGGKGISVAIVLNKLHADVNCLSCVGEADLPFFAQSMAKEGVRFHAIQVPGDVRRNLKIIDGESGVVTEFNELGAPVSDAAFAQVLEALKEQAKGSQIVALCGSLPPGCAEDAYRTLMQTMPDKLWAVDTSGPALRHAVLGKPFLIKPNHSELEELVGEKLATPEAIKNAAVKLCQSSVRYAAVSLGGKGAILTDGAKTVFAPAVPVTMVTTLGAGDSMLAGLLFGLSRGESVFDSLRYGVAAGATCVQAGGVHAFTEAAFSALLSKVQAQEL